MHQPQKLPTFNKLMYALGQMGWSLASYSVVELLNYFYMPPAPGQEEVFPLFIDPKPIIWIFPIVGLVAFLSRIVDAFTDPLIAGMSDRSTSKFGRRKKFMALGTIPFAVLSVLVFVPPMQGVSSLNVVWLAVAMTVFYISMTLYVTPYNALISELGHNEEERLSIATYLSFTFALGFGLGIAIFSFKELLEARMGSVIAFQTVLGAYALISLILMWLPIIFIDEDKYCQKTEPSKGTIEAMKDVFSNKPFRKWAFIELTYWLSQQFIIMGLIYYVTILIGKEESFASVIMACVFVASMAYYIPINMLTNKFGKKKLLLAGFVSFMLTFLFTSFLGVIQLPTYLIIIILMIIASIPMAVFGIIPNALVADIADRHGKKTGNYNAATFFSIKFFMMKIGISLSNLIFPALLIFGRSTDNPLGVRLTAVAALIFCVIGFLMMLNFDEYEEV